MSDVDESFLFEDMNGALAREAREALRRRSGRPVSILVIGQTGSGKSTLINALMGCHVARVQCGAMSTTRRIVMHEGEFRGVRIRICDTAGFNAGFMRLSTSSIMNEITAHVAKVDLILICVRMDSRADDGVHRMFTDLSNIMSAEAWERTVVVLTFANFFFQQISISHLSQGEALRHEVYTYKDFIFTRVAVRREIMDGLPFCIAGTMNERTLPDVDDWLLNLWTTCLHRCGERPCDLQTHVWQASLFFAVKSAIFGFGNLAKGDDTRALGSGLGARVGTPGTGK